jgi:hypothetical protein
MNYLKHYKKLIDRSKDRIILGYSEKHHIVPRCLGGGNEIANIAILTAEEHFVAHQLLCKMHPGNYRLTMAAAMMCASRPTNKYYSWLRKKHAMAMKQSQSGVNNSQYGTCWINRNGYAIKIDNKNLSEFINEGWELGRIKKIPKIKNNIPRGMSSDKYAFLLEDEEQILLEFDKHKSITKILHQRGFKGREGNSILSNWLKMKGRTPRTRRNTSP